MSQKYFDKDSMEAVIFSSVLLFRKYILFEDPQSAYL